MRTINLDNYRNSINYYGGAIRNSVVEYFISFLEQGEEITEEVCEYVFTANNQAFRGHISRIEDADVINLVKCVFAIQGIHFRCLQPLKAIVFCWKDKYYYISY
jgi:hypothetical protein